VASRRADPWFPPAPGGALCSLTRLLVQPAGWAGHVPLQPVDSDRGPRICCRAAYLSRRAWAWCSPTAARTRPAVSNRSLAASNASSACLLAAWASARASSDAASVCRSPGSWRIASRRSRAPSATQRSSQAASTWSWSGWCLPGWRSASWWHRGAGRHHVLRWIPAYRHTSSSGAGAVADDDGHGPSGAQLPGSHSRPLRAARGSPLWSWPS
jgi:hypothetical protein